MLTKSFEDYRQGRDALLQAIETAIAGEPQIVAAWLFGSFGRGTQDDLSDLDVWLVVSNADIDEMVARRRDFVKQFGKPVLMLEAPQNAPVGGGYLMVYYDGPVGAYQVDWYWQPEPDASVPAAVRILKSAVELTHEEREVRFANRPADPAITNQAAHIVGFFWAMLHICAKYAAREPGTDQMALLQVVLVPWSQIGQRCGESVDLEVWKRRPQQGISAKIQLLRQLGQHMMAWQEQLAQAGTETPQDMALSVLRFLDYTEEVQGAE